ncbi:hypothetical protein L207DRAFT_515658 [Hyaloscypha variabilis F]|uniref:SUN domain-containing protein n=1 Tax=Hyaloscypha variabilis (strain UAMH 11265 / GT02V1 / F) TaxID=1149755 RepID=A0A2J6RBL8_HYAVF|nr:hypothetical protein L207DRAFT_515658 [Hyaloscypha variabilis F]
MSTRRSTRATSRQASDRGASPAISTADIPATPRRASRRGGTPGIAPLPAIGTRTSTAYGTNTVPEPPRGAGPQVGQQLNSVLGGILDPIAAVTTPGRRSRTPAGRGGRASRGSTPAPSSANRSFNHESAIFNQAAIDESVVDSPELNDIPEVVPESPDTRRDREDAAQRTQLEVLARRRLFQAQARAASGQSAISNAIQAFGARASLLLKQVSPFRGKQLLVWAFILLLGGLAATTIWHSDVRFYGWDVTHNIGQFIPYSVAHPMDSFSAPEIKEIHRRLNDLEYQVARIKTHPEIDPKTLAKLEKMLPDALLVKKDKYGNLAIPDDFWHALQDKIRSDQTLISYQTDGKSTSPTTSLSVKEVERIAGKEYEKFMKKNQARMTALLGDELGRKFPQLLEGNHVASKAEILRIIRQSWEDNQKEIKTEMAGLSRKLENTSRQIQKLHQEPAGLTANEVKAISEEVVRKVLPHAQIEALARSNLQQTVNYGLTRVNHFSKGTGAVIDPYNTSPNYVFPSQDVYFWKRWSRAMILNSIPAPKAPETALTRWEEHGDCWCSPSSSADGFGTSLGVIMANTIHPDQVVVEHISPSAALEPGAAPREMELFALIDTTSDTYNELKALSESVFGTDEEISLPYGWVRIASFTYDKESTQNVQSFPVQLDMKALRASTNKIIVRSKNNWGGEKVGYTCIYRVRLHGEIAA